MTLINYLYKVKIKAFLLSFNLCKHYNKSNMALKLVNSFRTILQ